MINDLTLLVIGSNGSFQCAIALNIINNNSLLGIIVVSKEENKKWYLSNQDLIDINYL